MEINYNNQPPEAIVNEAPPGDGNSGFKVRSTPRRPPKKLVAIASMIVVLAGLGTGLGLGLLHREKRDVVLR